jgi:hypothetical protein
MVAVSSIGGGNRSTLRKPPTCRKSLTNFIRYCCTPRPERKSNHNISSDSKWPGTIYKFIVIFQHFSLKKIKMTKIFLYENSKKKIPKENCISLKKFQISYWKTSPFANPRRSIENIGNNQI